MLSRILFLIHVCKSSPPPRKGDCYSKSGLQQQPYRKTNEEIICLGRRLRFGKKLLGSVGEVGLFPPLRYPFILHDLLSLRAKVWHGAAVQDVGSTRI